MIVGGVGNGATEEGWPWDLNPGTIPKREPLSFGGEGGEGHEALQGGDPLAATQLTVLGA